MAESNQQRVNRILEHTRAGLGPYVLREFERVYGALDLQEVEQALFRGFDRGRHFADRASALARLDVQAWLNLMNWRWREVFRHRLGQTERGYVSELQGARNRSHHDAPDTRFSTDETRRVAETARLLLEAVGAAEQAREVAQIQQGLQNVLAQQAATASRRAAERVAPANATTTAGLKSWRLLVEPHRDVREGSFRKAEFAADLAQVVSGKAQAEYGDPQEFFRRTWLTEGLQNLLLNGLRRVSGQGGDPVVQLQTNFGGGKTHSMLALWHLLGGAIALSELPEGEALLQQAGDIDERIEARRAVIVGTAFDANVARQHESCETRTIWGEIAWQLGGLEGYRLVEDADRAGISPGGDVLLTLLESHGPALVIIDELVAFARNIYGTKTPAGSFDSLMSFVQSLSEATRRSSDAILLVSIPQSRLETGGEGGQAAHDSLTNILGRIDSVWKPVSTRESFAIVRRRLFEPQVDAPARDAVLTAFHAMYRRDSRDFPREAGTSDYKQQMLEAWPVHPELFTRLYEDWTTLDRFQRTRGVLRMMAEIIHRLWAGNDQSLMIMPGSIPLHEKSVRTQVQQWLPENWPAIVESDVDGESSRPWQLDGEVSTLGKYMACRRVARAIFTGSAPATGIEATRGVDETRIRLATRQPGEPAAPFNDALRRMGNRLNYLYHEDGRYWYDTQITVARRVAEHAQGISDAEQNAAMLRRLRAQPFPRGEGLASVHVCPRDSDEVPDELKARLVLLDLDHAHRRGVADSPAMQKSRTILENRGTAPRSYRNMLVFLAPDMPQVEGFRDALRDYLAWSWMRERIEEYNLDPRQARQVESSLKSTEQTLQERLQHTWRWLIVPTQRDASAALEYSPVWLSTATGREGAVPACAGAAEG